MSKDSDRDESSCDVVLCTAFPYFSIIANALRYARRRSIPFAIMPFIHLGDLDHPSNRLRKVYLSPVAKWLLNQADCIFVQTESERQAILDCGIPETRIKLSGLGIDPEECTGGDRDKFRQKHSIANDEIVIGHLANQSVEKGTVDLLQAVSLLWDLQLRVRLVLAGSRMPNFDQFWANFSHRDRVIQLGKIDDQAKRDFFAGIDTFCMPSISDSFGLVFLEAWANGKPVVGYRAGGVADLIRDHRDGLLVRCGDIKALADALKFFILDKRSRDDFGQTGKSRIHAEFRIPDKIQIVRESLLKIASSADRR